MKIRIAFVSNSSSASFIIQKSDLTDLQIEQIKNYQETAKKLGDYKEPSENSLDIENEGMFGWIDTCWGITETNTAIEGDTIMDNFNFLYFLKFIGVPREVIKYSDES